MDIGIHEYPVPALSIVPFVIREARRPLGGQGQNLRSNGQQTTGGSVLVPASTTAFRGMK